MTESFSKYVISGGAGFIGSHLVDALLTDPTTREVRIVDNFTSGRREHLAAWESDTRLKVFTLDLLRLPEIVPVFEDIDCVYHLAANPDARYGIENTRLDLELETIATYHVLEAMRQTGSRHIILASSGTVYGDIGTEPAVETRGPLLPTSLYGSGKVASEALIAGFCGTFDFSAVILRFGNIVGERTTHGVIFDFIRKLSVNNRELQVLGDGHQAKPYVYVLDLVGAMRHVEKLLAKYGPRRCEVFNVAPSGATSVRFIAGTLLDRLGLGEKTKVMYQTTAFGWAGDIPQSRMDATRLAQHGYCLKRSSDEAVVTAVGAIVKWLETAPPSTGGLALPHRD